MEEKQKRNRVGKERTNQLEQIWKKSRAEMGLKAIEILIIHDTPVILLICISDKGSKLVHESIEAQVIY
ncbi:hypothetical protein ACOSQ3_004268 [Xanthoceras sorbifolium]